MYNTYQLSLMDQPHHLKRKSIFCHTCIKLDHWYHKIYNPFWGLKYTSLFLLVCMCGVYCFFACLYPPFRQTNIKKRTIFPRQQRHWKCARVLRRNSKPATHHHHRHHHHIHPANTSNSCFIPSSPSLIYPALLFRFSHFASAVQFKMGIFSFCINTPPPLLVYAHAMYPTFRPIHPAGA